MAGEVEFRKDLHIKLYQKTHGELRVVALRNGLSVQEILEECACRITAGERQFMKLIEELVEMKRTRIREKLTTTDADSLYDMLELIDPFKKEKPDDVHTGGVPGTKPGGEDGDDD